MSPRELPLLLRLRTAAAVVLLLLFFGASVHPQPTVFTKVSPPNGVTGQPTSLTLSWSTSPEAVSYSYCYDTINNDSCDTAWLPAGPAISAALSLNVATTYYWQVRGDHGGATTEADGGQWWVFTTEIASPGVFGKVGPPNGSSGLPSHATLSWGTSSGATEYHYCLDTTDNNQCDGMWVPTGQATSAPVGLAVGTTYYWQVRAKSPTGTTYADSHRWWTLTSALAAPGNFFKTTPFNGAAWQPNSLTLRWEPSIRATSYQYCYDTVNNDSCDVTWVSAGTATSATVNLTASTVYYWQVRAENNGGTTYANLGQWNVFTTKPPGPALFGKSSPRDGHSEIPTNPTLIWYPSANATTYEYCVDAVDNQACDTSWVSTGTATIASVNLSAGLTYEWQVRAHNTEGVMEADGFVWWSFTTQPLSPAPFAKSSPGNGQPGVPSTPTLIWYVSDRATSYDYCIDIINNNVCDTNWISTTTSINPVTLSIGTTYYWQVRAHNAAGTVVADNGQWWVFATLGPEPHAFDKASPINGASGQPTTLSLIWFPSLSATSYEYCLDTLNNNVCDTSWQSAGAQTGAQVSLSASTTYYWQARAVNGAGTVEANSGQWWVLATRPPGPAPFGKSQPGNGYASQPRMLTLTWYPTNATNYQYCYDTTNNNACDTAWTSTGATNSASVTLSAGTTYYWQVRAENSDGAVEADGGQWWVFATQVETPGAFGKSAPANGATDVTASLPLHWATSARATDYQYCYDTTNNRSCDGEWISVGVAATASPILQPGTTYYWQARAQNVAGVTEADGSAWWAFTTLVAPPTAADDAYMTTIDSPLSVAAPGVLGNDQSNGAAMSATLLTPATHGTVTLGGAGGFVYTPAAGFEGTDSFTYHAVNAIGAGNMATVTVSVTPATRVQPPTDLYVASVSGNLVTLRWKPAIAGPPPTEFVVEGGFNPGDALGTIPTGSAYPILTFVAPAGSFYVRVHTMNGSERSEASNEVRLFVSVPKPPSAPNDLLATVNGDELSLSWRNTFAGGEPASIWLDVTGAANGTVPLQLSESFTFGPAPPGTYSFTVRGANDAGSSASSNIVTLIIPGPCSGVPNTPSNALAYRIGHTLHVIWEAPVADPAPTGYIVTVTGSMTGSVSTQDREVSGDVGPGSYVITVQATNACGSSSPTLSQTVVVP